MEQAIQKSIEHLKARRIVFEPGLFDAEVRRIEEAFRCQFPPDLRQFLQTALPVSGGFPNWRSESEDDLRHHFLNLPLQGILFDIEHNDFWAEEWGPRPATLEESLAEAQRRFVEAPTLIPVRSHHYLPTTPCNQGNPVLFVRQTDVTYAARDLWAYLADPFVSRQPMYRVPDARDIPFWTGVARRNKLIVPNLAATHAGQDGEYEQLRQAAEQAGYSAEVIPLSNRGKGVSFDREKPTGDRRHGFFWITKRDFGWLMWVKCPRLYYVPHEEQLVDLCLTLLARLPIEELNRGRLPFWNFKLDDGIRRAFDLVAVQHHTDFDDEREAKLRTWERVGWREMSRGQEDDAWNIYKEKVGYPAATDFSTPQPSFTWDVSPMFLWDKEKFDRLEADLTLKTLQALQQVTPAGEEVLALDWNHPCYFFDPHGGVSDASPSSWAVPVLPNGDHYLFLAQDFRFGLIGNCVDRTICVFGQPLLDTLAENPPAVFRKPTWTPEERRQKQDQWANLGWKRLSVDEKEEIWEQFDQQFGFYKHWGKAECPAITEPTPSLTWDISKAFLVEGGIAAEGETDLTRKILVALKQATQPGERLHALDALHWYEHYTFAPHRLQSSDRESWALPVLPHDNYTIILGPGLRFGIFGNPLEKTMCAFGEKLIQAITKTVPVVFGQLLRRNGVPELSERQPPG